MHFKKAETRPSFPELAGKVLQRWKSEQTFETSLKKSAGRPEFVFYDGPPFPTGNPHHGTIFVSILKDVVPRYKTMRGYFVPRAWGWDCHGLPIETQAEKNLGITDKTQIEKTIGVKQFNDECRSIVAHCNESWRIYIDKIGRWVDFDHPYSTMDLAFMESVIWAFAECHKKGLIYKDYRVSPYCYRCQTALSISDTRLDDSTRSKQDRAITVKFKVSGSDDTYFLAWTTTPWTLPSNLALAVGSEIEYVTIEQGKEKHILARAALARYQRELGKEPKILSSALGQELFDQGLKYEPLFSYFSNQNPNGFRLLLGDFVNTADGTGIVHIAPAYGEDDYWVCKKNNIQVIGPVDDKGNYTEQVTDFVGQNVHEANSGIVKLLKSRNAVVRDETIEHNYPHCWRCRTALIYRALDAWYLKVEAIKEQLIKNNELINWVPEIVKDGRFGKWLENARDWNISRNRYWATPIPVWECNSCKKQDVLGSVKEIEQKAGHPVTDLHKENLDPIRYSCECGGEMLHAPEVLDGWFESGSMPYGQWHYPFERAEHFKSHFPCDFIVEYTGQIRGWFYVLHVLSTALFDRPSFQNCLVHGTLLAADGKKISKSQKNYTDPLQLIDQHGPDALRAYLLSSVAVGMGDLNFKDEGVESMVKSINLPLWNAMLFFTTYAEIDKILLSDLIDLTKVKTSKQLDRFILSECELLIKSVEQKMDSYQISDACRLLPEFLETLNNWYIRRSRQRVWVADPRDQDKVLFYSVLHRVLQRFTLVLAPFCPFLAESVWEALGNSESVHLADWPKVEQGLIDEPLSSQVALARRIITAGLAIRAREKIRVRQPLQKMRIVVEESFSFGEFENVIKDELNIKQIEKVSDASIIADRVGKPNAKLLGPRFGGKTQGIIDLVKQGKFVQNSDGTTAVGEFTLTSDELEIAYVGKEGLKVESTPGAVVALDTHITAELELEGEARDLVRQIQELRKEADLNIADRIELAVTGADSIISTHSEYVRNETLAVALSSKLDTAQISKVVKIGHSDVEIALRLAVNK